MISLCLTKDFGLLLKGFVERTFKKRGMLQMVVKDLFHGVDPARVIARSILEDGFSKEEFDGWITKYYAQFMELQKSKTRRTDMMLHLSVICHSGGQYGCVGGFKYEDIKRNEEIEYAIEGLHTRQYASLYVPEYTVQRYGKEVVAGEVLREYGFHGYDDSVICPAEVRKKIWNLLENKGIESGIFPTDENYLQRCMKQFKLAYEGKKVPLWEEDKNAPGVVKIQNGGVVHVVDL